MAPNISYAQFLRGAPQILPLLYTQSATTGRSRSGVRKTEGDRKMDILYLGIVLACFGLTWALLALCARLSEGKA